MAGEASDVVKYYRVRKSWEDAKSQLGAYTILANAKAMADKHPDCPFMVKVSIPDLNIRKGAGTNTAKTGICTGVGVFTIMEVKSGKGSDAGGISLDCCMKV